MYKIRLLSDLSNAPLRIKMKGFCGDIIDIPDTVLNYNKNWSGWCVVLEHYKYKVSFESCKHCGTKKKVRVKVAYCRCGKLNCNHY